MECNVEFTTFDQENAQFARATVKYTDGNKTFVYELDYQGRVVLLSGDPDAYCGGYWIYVTVLIYFENAIRRQGGGDWLERNTKWHLSQKKIFTKGQKVRIRNGSVIRSVKNGRIISGRMRTVTLHSYDRRAWGEECCWVGSGGYFNYVSCADCDSVL